jgi:hypothetical protein
MLDCTHKMQRAPGRPNLVALVCCPSYAPVTSGVPFYAKDGVSFFNYVQSVQDSGMKRRRKEGNRELEKGKRCACIWGVVIQERKTEWRPFLQLNSLFDRNASFCEGMNLFTDFCLLQ